MFFQKKSCSNKEYSVENAYLGYWKENIYFDKKPSLSHHEISHNICRKQYIPGYLLVCIYMIEYPCG